MNRFLVVLAILAAGVLFAAKSGVGAGGETVKVYDGFKKEFVTVEKVVKTPEEWKRELSPQAFDILRKHDTERAFTGIYDGHHADGIYVCAGCGNHLYDSKDKFDSGTGWPSYVRPIDPANIGTETDRSFFTTRTEVHCIRCGGHLGHVFDDGPAPTFKRYCMNSASLKFIPREAGRQG